jgi:hypothetical protein
LGLLAGDALTRHGRVKKNLNRGMSQRDLEACIKRWSHNYKKDYKAKRNYKPVLTKTLEEIHETQPGPAPSPPLAQLAE